MQFAYFYPWLYQILKPTFSNCLWSGSPSTRAIALTFDDGPHPDYTPALLKVLDRYQVTASFFWLGVCVEGAPGVARAVSSRGHWLGLHGYTHRSFPRLSPQELYKSLQKTQGAIAHTCSIDPQHLRDVRPPNGFFTPQTLRLLREWQYRPVMWSVVPEDWVLPGVETVIKRVLQQVVPGSVIVLHDGWCGGAAVAKTVEGLIPQLLEQGYQFVSVDQLWQETSPETHSSP
jgi:peptidoglycan/xylan/chitin deacetylase (PgdA/CDA1 family)